MTVTPLGLAKNQGPIEYEFTLPDGRKVVRPLKDLFEMDTPTVKQGMHHIDGMLAFWGKPVRAAKLQSCTNLDVAPTILSLLGVPVPAVMPGQVLPVLRAGTGKATGKPAVDEKASLTSA